MKLAYRILFLLFVLLFNQQNTRAQLPEVLTRILKEDTAFYSLSCKLEIEVDVTGLNMPNKEIELSLEKGKKPKIKGKGLIILPKRGILGQYREFLSVPIQAIPMETKGDTSVYKIVSLDNKTDWVTVDLELTESDARVHSLLIATRKNGEFMVYHYYPENLDFFPEKTVIEFEAMPLKLPLKFLGKNAGNEPFLKEQDGPVKGKVNLFYSDIEYTVKPE